MFERIVVLAETLEQNFLPSVLQAENPRLDITSVSTLEELVAIKTSELRNARLIAFVSPVIVPDDVLRAVGHGAYNFHPGPPDYPGWAPAHFALYEQATSFGVTFHVMADRVDSGPILDVEPFPIPPQTTVLALEAIAYRQLVMMFRRWAGSLACEAAPLQPRTAARWSSRKNSRRSYRALCSIPTDISKDDLDRRVSVFGHGHFGTLPSIRLHGIEFTMAPRNDDHDLAEALSI